MVVDLCGVVISFRQVQPVAAKDGREFMKREITIADDTATSIVVTLWADYAKYEDQMFDGSPVIELRGVGVK